MDVGVAARPSVSGKAPPVSFVLFDSQLISAARFEVRGTAFTPRTDKRAFTRRIALADSVPAVKHRHAPAACQPGQSDKSIYFQCVM
jgi:hypothetical protein